MLGNVLTREEFGQMNMDSFKESFPLLYSRQFPGRRFLSDWQYFRTFG